MRIMFVKNDDEFICKNCGHKVPKLKYTSRDHCNNCLYSLHVDVTPGDRANTCKGLLKPVSIVTTGKKEQIEYVCTVCGAKLKNIIAEDDNKDAILDVARSYAKFGGK